MASRKRNRWDSDSSEDEGKKTSESTICVKSSSNVTLENEPKKTIEDNDNAHNRNPPQFSHLPLHSPLLNGCRCVYDCYNKLDRLDEGTYGIVWKAKDLATDEIVALKQIKFDPKLRKEGFPMAALREIGILLALSHENIVTVKEMVVGDDFDKVFMVMEFMQCDLSQAIQKSKKIGNGSENGHIDANGGHSSPFPQSEVKSMMHQILSATQHIHSRWILHRDLKTSNILVHASGKIALCDFGLARKYQLPLKKMTQTVITLWYRPIELLFGESIYGPEVDMWSIGCIFGELLKKEAMLQGQGELDQIDKIFKFLGSPTEEVWPGFKSLPNASVLRWKNKGQPKIFETFPPNSFSGNQTYLDSNGFDLLRSLLTLDPKKRLPADDALNHAYFSEGVGMKQPVFDM